MSLEKKHGIEARSSGEKPELVEVDIYKLMQQCAIDVKRWEEYQKSGD